MSNARRIVSISITLAKKDKDTLATKRPEKKRKRKEKEKRKEIGYTIFSLGEYLTSPIFLLFPRKRRAGAEKRRTKWNKHRLIASFFHDPGTSFQDARSDVTER